MVIALGKFTHCITERGWGFLLDRRMLFLQAPGMFEVKIALYRALLELMKLSGILCVCSV